MASREAQARAFNLARRDRALPLSKTPPATLADAAGGRDPDFLRAELESRLRAGSVGFRLLVQLAADGDPTDDVTALWPEDRERVELGRLEITGISATSAADERRLIFDPTNRTDGIDLSADPILLARSAAYAISYAERTKAS